MLHLSPYDRGFCVLIDIFCAVVDAAIRLKPLGVTGCVSTDSLLQLGSHKFDMPDSDADVAACQRNQ